MADYRIAITISGKDDVSDEIKKVVGEVGNLKKKGEETKKAGGPLSGIFGNLNKEVAGLVTGFGLLKGVQIVGELRETGEAVRRAETVFSELNGGVANTAVALERLRSLTGGVVTDFDLMQNSNKLLLSGLAKTPEELEKMIGLATTLGSAFGKDAGTSMEEFNLLLLNQSIPRLDTFGISAANVRARMNELKDAGVEASEAFKLAVFEEGEKAVLKLGDAATVGQTAWAKMNVELENTKNQLAEIVAGAAEAGAQLALITAKEIENIAEGEAPQTVIGFGLKGLVGAAPSELGLAQGLVTEDIDQIDDLVASIEEVTTAVRNVQTTQVNALSLSFREAEAAAERFARSGERAQQIAGWNILKTNILNVGGAINTIGDEVFAFADQMDAQFFNEPIQLKLAPFKTEDFQEALADFSTLGIEQAPEIPVKLAPFMTPEFQAELDSFSTLGVDQRPLELFRGLVTEAGQFGSKLTGAVTDVRNLATEAKAAADAFEKMSLSDLLGQTGGGRLGQLTDIIAGQITDEEQRAKFEEEAALASGRETTLSQAVESEIAPQIAALVAEKGPAMATEAAAAMLGAIEEGVKAGLSDQQIIDKAKQAVNVQAATGFAPSEFAGIGDQFAGLGIEPGVTPTGTTTIGQDATIATDKFGEIIELAPQVSEAVTPIGDSFMIMEGSAESVFQNMSGLPAALVPVHKEVSNLATELLALNAPVTIPVLLDVTTIGESFLLDLIRRAGGTVPGVDPRRGPS